MNTSRLLEVVAVVALLSMMSTSAWAQGKREARLDKGEILMSTRDVAGSDIPEATVVAVVNAPPTKVWKVVSECQNYKKTMVRILDSKLISKTGEVVICQVTTDMPWPISNLTSTTRAIHKAGPTQWSRTWTLMKGDFLDNRGAWKLTAFKGDPSRTLVTYKIHVVPDVSVPDAILRKAMKETLPNMMENLRKQVKAPRP